MASRAELSRFLADVERRAFKQAIFAVRDEDSALDIVQDSMMRLAEKYGDKPAEELPNIWLSPPPALKSVYTPCSTPPNIVLEVTVWGIVSVS